MRKIDYVYELFGIQYNYIVRSTQKDTREEFQLQIDDMKIRRGALTAILGANGSGKTTLLSLLGLLRKPLLGRIKLYIGDPASPVAYKSEEIWGKQDLAERIRGRYLGFALQNGELLPFLSVRENIELPLRLIGKKREIIQRDVKNWLTNLFSQKDISDNIPGKMPLNVSKGQYQRGAVARSLAHGPEIILADEPTGNLDKNGAEKMLESFRRYINTHRSVILVTHDQGHARDYADEIWVLKMGQISKHYIKDNKSSGWPDEGQIDNDMGNK